MSELWYKDGLRFKCTECGQCCTGQPGYVWVNEEEAEAIATHLNIPVEEFKKNHLRYKDGRYSLLEKDNYDCQFLDGKKCTIYPVRPTQCHTFPWWHTNLKTPESWKAAAKHCEGINYESPIVPLDTIERNCKLHEHSSKI